VLQPTAEELHDSHVRCDSHDYNSCVIEQFMHDANTKSIQFILQAEKPHHRKLYYTRDNHAHNLKVVCLFLDTNSLFVRLPRERRIQHCYLMIYSAKERRSQKKKQLVQNIDTKSDVEIVYTSENVDIIRLIFDRQIIMI